MRHFVGSPQFDCINVDPSPHDTENLMRSQIRVVVQFSTFPHLKVGGKDDAETGSFAAHTSCAMSDVSLRTSVRKLPLTLTLVKSEQVDALSECAIAALPFESPSPSRINQPFKKVKQCSDILLC
jgi:hypothetical protein